jgi:hypothetical protein
MWKRKVHEGPIGVILQTYNDRDVARWHVLTKQKIADESIFCILGRSFFTIRLLVKDIIS